MKPLATGEETASNAKQSTQQPQQPMLTISVAPVVGALTGTSTMTSASTQTQNTQPQTTQHSCGHSSGGGGTVRPLGNLPPSANASFIKPSLSLNSLPPQVPPEGSEMAQNRLRIDRPYNSLKKKRDSERELWRRSWGSGHSHSSCSLQSSTTTGIGKDDFWAALQTNYNFIMDTNLLDSCREARGEIEGPVLRPEDDDVDCCRRALYKPSPMQTFYGDPRLLRQWLREMETRIARIPSVTETKKLNIEQLLKLSGEHSEIHREIVSNSRAVAACVRAYEKKTAKASKFAANISGITSVTTSSSNTTTSTATNTSLSVTASKTTGGDCAGPPSGSGSLTPEVEAPRPGTSAYPVAAYQRPADRGFPERKLEPVKLNNKSKENSVVKGLERRYHLLYLKAIEIQCLLEGLLDSKTSSSDNNGSLSDTDEEPVNKLARLSSSVKSKSPNSLQNECLSSEEWVKAKKFSNAGFDADSEGSDCEIIPNIITYHHNPHHNQHPSPHSPGTNTTVTTNTPSTPPPSATKLLLLTTESNSMMEADINNLSTNTITTTSTSTTANTVTTFASAKHGRGQLCSEDIIDGIIREVVAQDLANNNNNNNNGNTSSSSSSHNNNSNVSSNENSDPAMIKTSSPKTSNGQSHPGKQKRAKISDLSKFNRTTRKSKNCATFYFKHRDTDSELNKDSSERTKSDESSSSSEGDEWVYNNGAENEEGIREEEGDVSQDSGGSSDPAQRSPGGEVILLGDEDEKDTSIALFLSTYRHK